MAKVNWKGGALLGPLPAVMVTVGDMDRANVITVAWTGIVSTHPPRAYISVRPTRHSYNIIKERGEFVINLTPRSLCEICDYCGIVTGRCVDKVAKCGLTLEPSETVSAPRIAQSPLALECRVFDVIPSGSHDIFLCDILSVAVDESLLDEKGKLHLDRADLVAFAHGEYYALAGAIGKFGFSVADKKKGRGAVLPKEDLPSGQARGEKNDKNPPDSPLKSPRSGKKNDGRTANPGASHKHGADQHGRKKSGKPYHRPSSGKGEK